MRVVRGGSGDFESRISRARGIEGAEESVQPLRFLAAVLEFQLARTATKEVSAAAAGVAGESLERQLLGRFPLLDLARAREPIVAELKSTTATLASSDTPAPHPLVEAGRELNARPEADVRTLVDAWLDDPSLLDPRVALWVRVAAGPVLELAVTRVEIPSKEEWAGSACPMCGDTAQCSAIVEESGGFLQGSPRYLICARCAAWWPFQRAVCTSCGEEDSRLITSYVSDRWSWARIDSCDTCRSYIKTFDLRAEGAVSVVPLVDDVATLTLDVWAHENGLRRTGVSPAGV